MARKVEFNLNLTPFLEKLKGAAQSEFKKEIALFLEKCGFDLLRIVKEEIIHRKVMDTRLLLGSFDAGSDNNVWEATEGGLTLEVGTSVAYADYVNDGHWTNPKGVEVRWVPGRWEGDRFIHDPNAKTGMALKQHWVEGAHYWDSAVKILEKMFPKILEEMLQEWINKYFGE